MKNFTRREFLGKSTAGLGAALIASRLPGSLETDLFAKTVTLPIGFQVWTIKDKLIADFPGTLKMMYDLGYRNMEMCSPPGYESSGFGPLMKMKPGEMKKIVTDAGLICESSHYGMGELRTNLQERIDFALESGQKQMILSSFWMPKDATIDDWKKAADELNKIGEKSKKAGIPMGFHNHHMEFAKIGDTLIYEELLKVFDPEYVKLQFQVAVISIGYKAADYFKKYPGRFISAHLADWSDKTGKEAILGQGVVDWKEFFASLKTGGVKNIFVEMSPDTFKDSAEFLKTL
ncbi:MAG: sugar phosphate isomerase/epimerase [Bacteroidetes bacterium]|nr:sugar phosphate isomerase/epimerase [Bacteroidota bacterium]